MSDLIERTMQIDTDEQMGRHYIPVTLERLRLGTGTSPDHELLLEAAKAIEEYRMKYILAAEGKDRAQRRLSELEAQLEELQKQEPVAWMARSGSGTTVLPDERMNKDYYNIPLYAAPTPPTPSQQELKHPTYGTLENLMNEIVKDVKQGYEVRLGMLGAINWFSCKFGELRARPDEVTK